MLGLVLIAAVPALATAWWHPLSPFGMGAGDGAALVELAEDEVGVAEAAAWGDWVFWIDARSAKEYASGHIPGAYLLNEDGWETQLFEVLDAVPLDEEGRVVVYCGSVACGASRAVADRLRNEAGLEPVYVLHGGWDAWQKGRE